MDQLLMSLRALVFLCAWYGTFGSALYLVLRAFEARASLRRAREPRMLVVIEKVDVCSCLGGLRRCEGIQFSVWDATEKRLRRIWNESEARS